VLFLQAALFRILRLFSGDGRHSRVELLQRIAAALAAVLLLPQAGADAQPYPSRPIKFVIPFGPGSASDTLARIAGQELTQLLGQPIVVIPKPGADGALSAIEVKRSAPDGYTFLFGTNSPLAVVPNNRKEPPYDVMADFTPVTFLGENSFFIVAHPAVPAKSLAELIAHAKANPGKVTYATPGAGTSPLRSCQNRRNVRLKRPAMSSSGGAEPGTMRDTP